MTEPRQIRLGLVPSVLASPNQPLSQRVEQRLGLLLADFAALVRRLATDLFFDAVQFADPLQRFPRHRGSVRLLQIVRLAPHVRPACGLLDAAVFVELIGSCIGIGLQRATKLLTSGRDIS
jgi:hypothetical protein